MSETWGAVLLPSAEHPCGRLRRDSGETGRAVSGFAGRVRSLLGVSPLAPSLIPSFPFSHCSTPEPQAGSLPRPGLLAPDPPTKAV